jgi:ABC-2 type transport system ATP-binding protein
MTAVLRTAPEAPPGARNVVLVAEGLTKRYGSLIAVHDLSLEIQAGEILGLLGPNGAGKTTSINMIVGLLRPDAGRVLIDGQAIQGGSRRLRSRVGICPQEIVLWDKLTCLEQLIYIGQLYGLPYSQARQRSQRLLAELGLAEKARRLAASLSGGMKRRLNLAMALVHDPPLIVLDEPEAGLDPQSRVLVREYVRSLADHKTVLLTTHNMDEAERVASRVAIIDHGRLLVVDTPQALKRRLGEDEVIEIQLSEPGAGAVSPPALQTGLARLPGGLQLDLSQPGWLLARAPQAARLLPDLLDGLRQLGVHTAEVRLRSATLEDVFLNLTGRRLRE